MRPASRARWPVLILLGLVLLTRAERAVTNALGDPTHAPIWDNPLTLSFDEINSLVSAPVVFTEPVREATSRLRIPRQIVAVMAPIAAPTRPGGTLPTGLTRAPPLV